MNNKEIIEDIKKHLTGINQVDIKYLNDQLKKHSKEKNDEVVYEIFTMIYKRLDPEALQKIHSQVESVQAKRIAEFTEAIKLYNNKEYAKSKEILLNLYFSKYCTFTGRHFVNSLVVKFIISKFIDFSPCN